MKDGQLFDPDDSCTLPDDQAPEPVDPLEAAIHAGKLAQDSVEHNARYWVDEARALVRRYLENHPSLHPDDLWPWFEQAGLEEPHDRRALGPVLGWAIRQGLMRRSDVTRRSISSHGSPKFVYHSNLWGEP